MNQKYIITGAPGTGKTTIINELKKQGYNCAEEISRAIIKEQLTSDCDTLPWKILNVFSERVITLRKAQYINAPSETPHFFDRGIIDVIAYLIHDGLAVNNNIIKMVKKFPYNKTVFYTPIWKEIYVNDTERKADINSAIKIEQTLLACYKSFGYSLISIPKLPTNERVDFILSKI